MTRSIAPAESGSVIGWARHTRRSMPGASRARRATTRRQEDELAVVARPEDHAALGGAGVERRRRRERPRDLVERAPDGGGERLGADRGDHPVAAPHEERVSREGAQSRQRVAHRALRDPDARRRARHVALFEEGVERDEEVQVDRTEMHAVHGENVRHPLESWPGRAHGLARRRREGRRRERRERAMFVVAGASGNTGKVVADTLLAQKSDVRVIVRDATKGEAWATRGARSRRPRWTTPRRSRRPCAGRGRVPAPPAALRARPRRAPTTGGAPRSRRGDRGERRGARRPALVGRGAARDGTGPIAALHDAEVAFSKLRADVTFVRAAYFMENWGGSLYALAKRAADVPPRGSRHPDGRDSRHRDDRRAACSKAVTAHRDRALGAARLLAERRRRRAPHVGRDDHGAAGA